MVESHVVSITAANHADAHRHGGGDPLTGDVRIDMQHWTTFTDVTGSRVSGTIYRNTSGVPMSVQIALQNNVGAAGTTIVVVEDVTPPTVQIIRDYQGSLGQYHSHNFVVMPNDYYKVTLTNSVIHKWVEYT